MIEGTRQVNPFVEKWLFRAPMVHSITASHMGLNGILIVNGVLCLATLVLVLVWYPTKAEIERRLIEDGAFNESNGDNTTLGQMYKSPLVWLFGVAAFCMGGGM